MNAVNLMNIRVVNSSSVDSVNSETRHKNLAFLQLLESSMHNDQRKFTLETKENHHENVNVNSPISEKFATVFDHRSSQLKQLIPNVYQVDDIGSFDGKDIGNNIHIVADDVSIDEINHYKQIIQQLSEQLQRMELDEKVNLVQYFQYPLEVTDIKRQVTMSLKESFTIQSLEQAVTETGGQLLKSIIDRTGELLSIEEEQEKVDNTPINKEAVKLDNDIEPKAFKDKATVIELLQMITSDKNGALVTSKNVAITRVTDFLAAIGKVGVDEQIFQELLAYQKVDKGNSIQDFLQGSKWLSLKLSPEHLGKLDVQLIRSDEETIVKLATTTTDAKKLIELQLNQMRQTQSNETFKIQFASKKLENGIELTPFARQSNDRISTKLNISSKNESLMTQDLSRTSSANQGTLSIPNIGIPLSQTVPFGQAQQFVLHVGENLNEQQRGEQLLRQFQNILGRSSLLQLVNGTNQLTIKLFPEHLGRLDVKLIQQEGMIVAKLMTTTKTAKNALESQLHQLRQAFIGQNLQVEKIEITTQQQQLFNTEKEQQQEKQNNQQHKRKEENDSNNNEAKNENENFKDFLEETINLKV